MTSATLNPAHRLKNKNPVLHEFQVQQLLAQTLAYFNLKSHGRKGDVICGKPMALK